LDFLDGYGFLAPDGDVSEDELDSSTPDLPTSVSFTIQVIALFCVRLFHC